MKPNLDQVLSAVRTLLASVGGYAVGRGLIGADTLVVLTGAVLAIVPLLWGFLVHTNNAKVAAVDALAKEVDSPVKGIIMEANPAGLLISSNLPGTTTVTAGTHDATVMAKAGP